MVVAVIGGAVVSGGFSLLAGRSQAKSAEKAGDLQAQATRESAALQFQATREATGEIRRQYDVSRADLSPYRATGGAALHTLSNMFIPGGQNVVQMRTRLNELQARRAMLAGGQVASGPSAPARARIHPSQRLASTPGGGTTNMTFVPGAGWIDNNR